MEHLKKYNKNILYIFIGNFITTLICYGMFLQKHFSVDSYAIIYDNAGQQYLMQGRIISYILNKFLNAININPTINQQILSFSLILSIAICSTILVYILWDICGKLNYKSILIINLLVSISFLNVFLLEWFLYPEITLFLGFGLVLTTLAIWVISIGDKKSNLFVSFFLMFISMEIYQADLGIFIIYALTICFIKNKGTLNRKSIVDSIKILIIGGLTSIINIVMLKGLVYLGIATKSDRDPKLSIQTIIQNMHGIIKLQKDIWLSTYNFLPRYFTIIFAIIIIGMILVNMKIKSVCKKSILYFLCLVLINYSIVFAPHVFTSSLWMAQRTIIGFFVFLSFLGFILLFYLEDNEYLKSFTIVLLTGFLSVNFIYVQLIGSNHIASNRMDEEFSILINNEIEKYESENNTIIKNIAVENDTNPTYCYKNIKYCMFDTNVRAFITPWANVNMINYYTNSNYKKVEMNEEVFYKCFKGKNWDSFNIDEQLVFKGDTLYLIVY